MELISIFRQEYENNLSAGMRHKEAYCRAVDYWRKYTSQERHFHDWEALKEASYDDIEILSQAIDIDLVFKAMLAKIWESNPRDKRN